MNKKQKKKKKMRNRILYIYDNSSRPTESPLPLQIVPLYVYIVLGHFRGVGSYRVYIQLERIQYNFKLKDHGVYCHDYPLGTGRRRIKRHTAILMCVVCVCVVSPSCIYKYNICEFFAHLYTHGVYTHILYYTYMYR